MTATDRQLEDRVRAAAPAPGPPPDVDALWRRARRARRHRVSAAALGTAAFVGLGAVAGAVALRPGVEFAPGATGGEPQQSAEPQQTTDPDEAYCEAAAPFLGEVLEERSGAGGAGEGSLDEMTPEDFRDSHAEMTAQFADAGAAAPAELAEHWQALQDDLAAQGEVWESIDWDPGTIGWPALHQAFGSLPTAAAGSHAMEVLLDDFEARCTED